ncbi:histidine kinase [Aureitalea sp. L0-47]|uniref:PAS domain-containing sensor histidine kinase n=1 Tax=Aureitalea sp. L0-47 TaxID=2816962 RepID=UPI00223751CE|nr:ATP-binding protein [Aureitalea sp. L0-47]MCW5518280.1 histidine kinase [Aureitalea sp. L0-47]
MNFLAQKRRKILSQHTENHRATPPAQDTPNNFYYKEIAKLTGCGVWSVDFPAKKTFLDAVALRILEIPESYHISLRNALDFYTDEYKEVAVNFYLECAQGLSFSTTVKMQTFTGKEIWVRASGEPTYNDQKEVVGIKGVFQDVTNEKKQELQLRRSLKLIESQNTKLNNFANIVTHSMHAHTGNLEMTLELMKGASSLEEKEELCNGLYEISESISNTIRHLKELSEIQTTAKRPLEIVDIDSVLEKVKNRLGNSLGRTRAEIFNDFSEVPTVEYIPSYMESILFNLITNAIKYRHPERSPVIEIYSIMEEDSPCLMVKDNGLGIDLDSFGERIFNIYETFHNNTNAEGVGLFILKNKIESLNGTISVQSEVDKGSTFIVRF